VVEIIHSSVVIYSSLNYRNPTPLLQATAMYYGVLRIRARSAGRHRDHFRVSGTSRAIDLVEIITVSAGEPSSARREQRTDNARATNCDEL